LSNTATELAARHGPNYKWWVTLTVMIGTLSLVVSSTIVNVAVPHIMRDFMIGHDQAQWLSTAFLAAMTLGMLLNGWCVPRFGVRNTYIGAMVLFVAASVIGGLAPRFEWLVLARAVQGLMGGLIQPLAMIVIFSVFPPGQQGRAMGIYGMGVVLGPAVGPVIGGYLVDAVSWHWLFFAVLPACFLGIAMARKLLEGRTADAPRPKLDVLGLVLLSYLLLAFLWAIPNSHARGWTDPLVRMAWLSGTVALVAFVLWELRASRPLLDLRVFRSRGFVGAFFLSMTVGITLFSSTYLIPLFVQEIQGFSAADAGSLLLPAGLGMAFMFPLAGHLTDRFAPTGIIVAGLIGFGASAALMAASGTASTFWALAAWILLGRLGLGLMMPPVTAGGLRLLPKDVLSQGAGVVNFGRQLGGAFGVNLLSLYLERRTLAGGGHAVLSAYSRAFHETFLIMAVICVLALLPLWFMYRAEARPQPIGPLAHDSD